MSYKTDKEYDLVYVNHYSLRDIFEVIGDRDEILDRVNKKIISHKKYAKRTHAEVLAEVLNEMNIGGHHDGGFSNWVEDEDEENYYDYY